MSALAFHPAYQGAGDGYNVFQPESLTWAKRHGAANIEVIATKMKGTVPRAESLAETNHRLEQVLAWVDKAEDPITDICFCCHGWRTGNQMGLTLQNTRRFVERVAGKCDNRLRIWMQSCTCGGGPLDQKWIPAKNETGDRGLADLMRDQFCIAGVTGVRVDAHATAGHATWNPYVRRFDGKGNVLGGRGGEWIVNPFDPEQKTLWNKWRNELANDHSTLRYDFTMMEIPEIHEYLMTL